MVKGLGIDITSIERITQLVERYDRETLTFLFTAEEINRAQTANHPHLFYTVCFASKEAVGKAFGTGLVGIGWQEIEAIIPENCELREIGKNCNDKVYLDQVLDGFKWEQSGHKLAIRLYGEASIRAKKWGFRKWLATWCHWDEHVLVQVLAQ